MILVVRRLCLLFIIAMAFAVTDGAQARPLSSRRAVAKSTLTVNADKARGFISRYVYGANHGPWSLVPQEQMPAALASHITYLRFPGGNWGDENNLQPYQIDMFLTMSRQIGAEPSISVRLKGGTPQAAAELVRYVNVEKRYGVRYWSVGNEPDLYKDYVVEQYNQDWRKIALAMRAVDPSILLVGPDVSQYPPLEGKPTDKYHDWLKAFLKANGDLVDIVSIHRYPFPKGLNQPATTIDQLRLSAREWDDILPTLRRVVREATNRDVPVAVTEVNSHWSAVIGGEASPDSYYNAIWWADALGRIVRQQVTIVAYFTLYSTGDVGAFGIIGSEGARPTYNVYQLYSQLGTTLLESSSDDADITITAAIREDGTLTLIVINPTFTSASVALQVTGTNSLATAELWRLDLAHQTSAVLGPTADVTAGQLELPEQSISLYIISNTVPRRPTVPVRNLPRPLRRHPFPILSNASLTL